MDDLDRSQTEQLLKLVKENNRMLHAMRRNAWLSGFFKLVTWGVLIILPLWLYMQYLAPVMGTMMNTMQQLQEMQGVGTQAQAQFGDLNAALKKLQTQFPQYFQQ